MLANSTPSADGGSNPAEWAIRPNWSGNSGTTYTAEICIRTFATGRNDIVAAKVSIDDQNISFYVRAQGEFCSRAVSRSEDRTKPRPHRVSWTPKMHSGTFSPINLPGGITTRLELDGPAEEFACDLPPTTILAGPPDLPGPSHKGELVLGDGRPEAKVMGVHK